MVASLSTSLTALLAIVPAVWAQAPAPRLRLSKRALAARQNFTTFDETPVYPHDPNTAASCRWWWDNDGSIPCASMPAEWGISMANFLYWNPSITAQCGNFNVGQSYCVEADPPSTGPSSTTASPTTTTAPGNGVTTPTPTQSMVGNCNKFHFVEKNQNCDAIAGLYGISRAQFVAWNPDVGPTCTGMWAEVYVCVGLIGQASPTPTTTKPGNGITTPTPTQAMVGNCNKFHFVAKNENCDTIASKYGITRTQFVAWNPDVGSTCTGMWAEVYVCVGLIGQSTPTTTPGNGITTPTPTQAMVGNCNKFHFVAKNENCDTIASRYGISRAQFVVWNPDVGSTCTGMWAEVYVCVATIGFTPSPTTTGNGITTPTPTQAQLVGNCNKFYWVNSGENCDTVARKNGITTANFIRWNPSVGSDCKGLWANAYSCIGVRA